MSDPLEAVNELVRMFVQLEQTRRKAGDEESAQLHSARHNALTLLVEEVLDRRRWMTPVPASYGDISDLPDELLAQLSGIKTDELEDQIYAVVKAAGPEVELDRLLIELFRRFGDVHERRFINNKCYRMAQKGLIFPVAGRKGIYTLQPPAAPEQSPPEANNEEQRFEVSRAEDFDNLTEEEDDDIF